MEKNTRIDVDVKQGLTKKQVVSQREKGLSNIAPKKVTKDTKDIMKDNIFTLFNLLNFLIAFSLAMVGAYSNMFFIFIIIVNIIIGITQEIHARNLVEKLSLLSVSKASVIREGECKEVFVEELVQDDIIQLEMGMQICADSIVVSNEIEVNESLLTGESDSIIKKKGDFLYSGSFVVSGRAFAKVERVGEESYSSKILEEMQKHKGVNSELLDALTKVTKFTTFVIIPFGFVLFLEAYFIRSDSIALSVVATSAALLGMLPKGLMLLISISSATGVIKLSKKEVLVQEMHCMETLAHVDMLCLDKTGTITEGNMKVLNSFSFQEKLKGFSVYEWMSRYIQVSEDNNATFLALREYFKGSEIQCKMEEIIPFSSERKWGSIQFEGLGSIVLGAPEMICAGMDMPKEVVQAQESGSRVLVVAYSVDSVETGVLPQVSLIGAIELDDPIRKNAVDTLNFFKGEGVGVKVISGDNPVTVSNVARKAGLADFASYIDLSTMKKDEDVRKAALEYSVFGRVSPKQKRVLIQALKDNGHTVAMTGDGVNDVLALREADCSIAMAEGNDATKQISQIVLLNSDFSTLPIVLSEGRRVVNNVTKVSSIFFIKTLYSVMLTIICILGAIAFPFIPVQITLIDLAIEGYPSFFLSFESNKKKVTGTYLKTSLMSALPNAVFIILNILFILFISNQLEISTLQRLTLMYYIIGFISVMSVLKACLPFNKLRIFLFASVSIGFYTAIYLFRSTLKVSTLDSTTLPIFIALSIVTALSLCLIEIVRTRSMVKKEQA